MDNQRRGVSLPELLGAIVIFGIVSSLLAAIAFSMLRAINRIAVSQHAEIVGLNLISELETTMSDAQPNTYSEFCPDASECIVLIQEYRYEYDSINGSITTVVHASPIKTQLSIRAGAIWVGNEAIDISGFVMGPQSTISITVSITQVMVTISFELIAADGRMFPFMVRYAFTQSTIPS
jgi:prepilin-type N-terminal cleavage/methylation domain-containing protein